MNQSAGGSRLSSAVVVDTVALDSVSIDSVSVAMLLKPSFEADAMLPKSWPAQERRRSPDPASIGRRPSERDPAGTVPRRSFDAAPSASCSRNLCDGQ